MRDSPVITLPFPNNESRREGYNSLTALDYIINSSNILTATFHVRGPAHPLRQSRFLQSAAASRPNTSDSTYSGNITEHASLHGHAARQRALRHQFPRRRLAAGRSAHDAHAVAQRGQLLQPADAHVLAPRMARNLVALAKQLWGTHNLKFGSVVGGTAEHALINEHPVNIVDPSGRAASKALTSRRDCRSPAPTWNRPSSRRISGSLELALLAQPRRSRRTAGSHRSFPASARARASSSRLSRTAAPSSGRAPAFSTIAFR